jgi:hypothetical protein
MVGRAILSRAEPGFTLPAFDRLAPPPPPELVAARIEAGSGPGDIVADLHGRGGWIARAAIDRQRRACTLESNPLTRLLAEVVLRPPDLRHLDAAFSTLSASPRGESSLKLSIGAMFGTRCTTCGRALVADEFQWAGGGESIEAAHPVRKQYRCTICRDQQGGLEQRHAAPDEAVLVRSTADVGADAVRGRLRERFPTPDGGSELVDAILGLHTDRQLVGLWAILERIEGELRAAPVESALRLAFLHAILPASRLGAGQGRVPGIRIAGGTVRSPIPDPFRERNPWLAFEEAFRVVRGFVQRLESGALGPLEARIAVDLRGLAEGAGTAVIRVATAGALEGLAAEARDPLREPGREAPRPRIRLVLGQPPLRFSQERLAAAYHGTCWALGREAASLLPLEPLVGSAIRAPWSWQAAALRRSLAAVAPLMARDGRAVLLLEAGGPEASAARWAWPGIAWPRRASPMRTRTSAGSSSSSRPGRSCRPGREPARIVFDPIWRERRPGPGPRPRPLRAARATRGPAVLARRSRAVHHRDRRRGPPRARRTGPVRAAPRRDPRRARPGGPPPPARGPGRRRGRRRDRG